MMPTRPKRILYLSVVVSFFFFGVITIKNSPTPLVYAAPCGNGVCQPSQGEDCNTCPADCGVCPTPTPPPTTPTPSPSTPTPDPSTPTPGGTSTPLPTGVTPAPTTPPASGDSSTTTDDSSTTTSTTAQATPTPVNTIPPQISTLPLIPIQPTDQQIITIAGTVEQTVDPIALVEVSLDGGQTWLGASLNGNRYFFVSDELEDGNYEVRIRVTDIKGVSAVSKAQTLIVDILPPMVGGGMVSSGSLIISPSADGVITLASGIKSKYIFSAKGGVIKGKITISGQDFEIKPISKSDLFYAEINPEKPGIDQIKVETTDGAGQTQTRVLGTVSVKNSGRVVSKNNSVPIVGAKVSVYFFENDLNDWVMWDGNVFGQDNPQTTSQDGTYAFMLPEGKYFVEINSKGYKKARSEIFEVENTSLIDFNFVLKPLKKVSLFSFDFYLPSLLPSDSFSVNVSGNAEENEYQSSLLSKDLPRIKTSKTLSADTEQYTNSPLIIFFISSWSPNSQDQLVQIQKAKEQDPQANILVVFVQDSPSFVVSLVKRGNYSFDYIVDKNGFSANDFNLSTLPQSILIDSQQKISKIIYNNLGFQDIINLLKG